MPKQNRQIAHPLVKSNSMPDFTDEEREFIAAVERYRTERKVKFPTAVDLLRLAHALGYRKVQPADETKLKLGPLTDKRVAGKCKTSKPSVFSQNICNKRGRPKKGTHDEREN